MKKKEELEPEPLKKRRNRKKISRISLQLFYFSNALIVFEILCTLLVIVIDVYDHTRQHSAFREDPEVLCVS